MGMTAAKYGNNNRWIILAFLDGVQVAKVAAQGVDQWDAADRAKKYFKRHKIAFDATTFLGQK